MDFDVTSLYPQANETYDVQHTHTHTITYIFIPVLS